MTLVQKSQEIAEALKDFEIRDDDVFICGYPKSGTRWVSEMVWLLRNEMDFKGACQVQLHHRIPFLELELIFESSLTGFLKLEDIKNLKRPRLIKTHLPWEALPEILHKKAKMIVVLRSPEDVCVSNYFQSKLWPDYIENFDEFCKEFLEENDTYGVIWNHILSFWEQRHRSNIMFIKYAEMKRDLDGIVRKTSNFINTKLSNDDIVKICKHLPFDNLKKISAFNNENLFKLEVNPFTRKGIVGDHKNHMSAELIEMFRKRNEEYFSGVELTLS